MSEGEANRRIAVARVVRRFPLARGYLESGAIHLCAVYEMHKHLTEENHEELLREASGKSTKAVAEMIAARFPKPDVHPCIEPFAPQASLAVATTEMSASGAAASPAPPMTLPVVVRPRVEPLSATRYRVELTVSAETKAKLERIKDLMRHRNPTGDLEKIFDVSLELLLVKLEKERLGKTSRPIVKKSAPTTERPPTVEAAPKEAAEPTNARATKTPNGQHQHTRRRRIATAVRREVFARDGEQCTYVDAEGNRCPARGYLELDHVHAKALGGGDEAANLRVRCRPHNLRYAEQVFGRAYVEERIHLRQRKCARPSARAAAPPAPPSSFEVVARGLRILGFREPEVRVAMARLQTMLDPAVPTETILREALRLLT